ncbi:MAG: DciA family protein [Acidimicrobiia bacterium]
MSDRFDDEPRSLAESLAYVTRDLGLARPNELVLLVQNWNALVGDALAAHAIPTHVRNGVLTIELDSNAWASPLRFLRDALVTRANEVLGGEVVHEIRTVIRGAETLRHNRPIRPVPGEN